MPSAEPAEKWHGLSAEAVLEAERHVKSCGDCSGKASQYRQLVNRSQREVVSQAAPPGPDCPNDGEVDWHEVASGLCPELKAKQLIMHAARCSHCGPLLRAATSVDDDPTPQEAKLLSQLRRQDFIPPRPPAPPWLIRRVVPALAVILIVAALAFVWSFRSSLPSAKPLSGAKFAEFAVSTHMQHAKGSLALDIHSDSQQALNEWLKAKSPFQLALPASLPAPGEDRPYLLKGAGLVKVAGKAAVYIAYDMQAGPTSLVVTPDSVAVASGGVQVDYKKVTFYYRTVDGYKVVTWSLHGRTYALVSQEGNKTQRSCMICHSAMRDRDLSQTPAPLPAQPVSQ